MMWSHFATSALILLVVLLRLTLTLPLTASVATETHSPGDSHAPSPLGLRPTEGENEGRKGGLPQRERAEEEDELFGGMDPKTLAAVLLEAMNKPHGERRNGVEDGRKEKERGKEENERERQEEEKGEEVRAALDEEGADRDRDGREELELVMAAAAAQGKEERERNEEEEEERKRAQEEEERLTEKVTRHPTSQMSPGQEKRPPAEGERGEEVGVK